MNKAIENLRLEMLKASSLTDYEKKFYLELQRIGKKYSFRFNYEKVMAISQSYKDLKWTLNAEDVMKKIESEIILTSGMEIENDDREKFKKILNQSVKEYEKIKEKEGNEYDLDKITLIKAIDNLKLEIEKAKL